MIAGMISTNGLFCSLADSDFYSFTLGANDILDVAVIDTANEDLDLNLFDSSCNLIQFFNTGPAGQLSFPFAGGGGPFDAYIQFLINDPQATQGVAFSNAIKAVFQP